MEMLKQLIIELTNACNSNCIMCLRRYMKRPVKHMELKLLSKIIDEVEDKQLATFNNPIGLCGIGEPTLHPQLIEALKIIKRVPFGFGTNCEALTPPLSKALIEARFTDFNLSIDAYTAKSHAKIKPGLHFNQVFNNSMAFIGMLRDLDFWRSLTIQFIVLNENVEEVRDFISFWLIFTQGLPNTTIYIKPVCRWPGGNGDDQHYPSPKFRQIDDPRVLYCDFDKPVTFRESCTMLDTFCQIQSDGAYSPCCMNSDDEYQIGNVKDHSIEELYSSPKMDEYRQLFKNKEFNQIPYCSNCYEDTISS